MKNEPDIEADQLTVVIPEQDVVIEESAYLVHGATALITMLGVGLVLVWITGLIAWNSI